MVVHVHVLGKTSTVLCVFISAAMHSKIQPGKIGSLDDRKRWLSIALLIHAVLHVDLLRRAAVREPALLPLQK